MQNQSNLPYEEFSRRRRRHRISSLVTLLVGVLVMPLVYEVALLGVAQWRGMNGAAKTAHTPILDTLHAAFQDARHEADTVFPALFRRVSWTPATVIPFAIFWAGIAAFLLRKC